MSELLRIGLVSISDRASSGVYEDKGIPALQAWFGQALTSPWEMETRLIPDEQPSSRPPSSSCATWPAAIWC
jgi:molybdopterin adenylyltransferase